MIHVVQNANSFVPDWYLISLGYEMSTISNMYVYILYNLSLNLYNGCCNHVVPKNNSWVQNMGTIWLMEEFDRIWNVFVPVSV